MKMTPTRLLFAAFACLLPAGLQAAATITIVNNDAAGVGFNDTTTVSPVGGNTGTTRGQQRLNAFQEAATIWGATLTSAVTIRIGASWPALTCTATSAVLGSSGAADIEADFSGAPVANRWYPKALANKISGSELDGSVVDITARFNVNLGNTGCLTGTSFYLGLDNIHGTNIDLVTVLLHEFAHGLGFQTYTSTSTGNYIAGTPSIWDDFLLDTTSNKVWSGMSASERVASAINNGRLVWSGSNVNGSISSVLTLGSPSLLVTAPATVAASYAVGLAAFGPALTSGGVTADIMPVVDTGSNTGLACTPLSAANAAAVNGKLALVDRGTCGFTVKVKNAQNAGAIGVIVADNAPGSPPPALGGADATITIPSVRITQADGVTLKAALAKRSRTRSGVVARLGLNGGLYQGADSSVRALMYAPTTLASGSSVSHFDITAGRNQLMEPSINSDLTHNVTTPSDLTFQLFKDLGWN